MKTLKKTLCVVLALIMLVGVMAIGSSAALTDIDKVQYTTAVGVMNGMGIIAGRDDGSFDPTANVNRAEAAKMICYALIGQDAADGLQATAAPFPDVPANTWYAPYVSYLKTVKVIGGYDDGKFYPTNPVTGLQLAKMLLVAAGYGQEAEYDGTGFAQNTYVDALTKGNKSIFKDTKATDLTKAATREEAALYIYNAMCYVGRVKYRPANIISASEYVGLGSTLASARYNYVPERTVVNNEEGGTTVLLPTAIEDYYVVGVPATRTSLRKDSKVTDKNKDEYYNRVAVVDTLDGTGTERTTVRIDGIGLDMLGHKVKVHLKDDGKTCYYLEDCAKTAANDVEVKTTGSNITFTKDQLKKLGFSDTTDADALNTKVISEVRAGSYTDASTIGAINNAGWVVNLIDNSENGKFDTAVYIQYASMLVKVTAYTAPTATATGSVTLSDAVNGKTTFKLVKTGDTDNKDEIKPYDGIKKDDYAYVTAVAGTPSLEPATVIVGNMSYYSSSTSTVDGKSYSNGTAVTGQTIAGTLASAGLNALNNTYVSADKKYNFVFYANGKLAGCSEYNEDTSYAVVLQIGAKSSDVSGDLDDVDAKASVRLALSDGTVGVYQIKLTKAQKAMTKAALLGALDLYDATSNPAGTIDKGTIVKIAISGNTLTSFAKATQAAGTIVKNSPTLRDGSNTVIAGKYYTADTKFVYWKTTDTDYKVTVATGYANAGSASGQPCTYVLNSAGDKVVLAYINNDKAGASKTGYLKSAGYGTKMDGDKTVYVYTLYIDGVAKSFSSESILGGLAGHTLVKYTVDDKGYLTDITTLAKGAGKDQTTIGKIDYADDSQLIIGGVAFKYTGATVITVDKNATPSAGGSVAKSTEGYYAAVVVTKAAEGSNPAELSYVYILETAQNGGAYAGTESNNVLAAN